MVILAKAKKIPTPSAVRASSFGVIVANFPIVKPMLGLESWARKAWIWNRILGTRLNYILTHERWLRCIYIIISSHFRKIIAVNTFWAQVKRRITYMQSLLYERFPLLDIKSVSLATRQVPNVFTHSPQKWPLCVKSSFIESWSEGLLVSSVRKNIKEFAKYQMQFLFHEEVKMHRDLQQKRDRYWW